MGRSGACALIGAAVTLSPRLPPAPLPSCQLCPRPIAAFGYPPFEASPVGRQPRDLEALETCSNLPEACAPRRYGCGGAQVGHSRYFGAAACAHRTPLISRLF